MRSLLRLLAVVCVISVVIILGVTLGWFGSKPAETKTQGQPPSVSATSESTPMPSVPTASKTSGKKSPSSERQTNGTPTTTSANATNQVLDWEDRLDAIVGAEGEDSGKVKQLLEMFPRLPEDGQVEVAQHLSNLVADQDYAPLGKLLADPKLAEAVLDVLIADVLNRPNAVKLPLLLEIARTPQHPKAEEAKDLLELYLEEDYGTDWNKWQAKMEQWIKDNPE